MRLAFDRELQRLQDEVQRMGSEVEEHLGVVTTAFIQRDETTAQRMIDADKAINERRIQLAMDTLTLIARQQPIASDLRLIAAIMEIVGELERIHDYIKGIARISLNLGRQPISPTVAQLMPEMAETTQEMLRLALRAFVERDKALARCVPALDDRVDAMFNELYTEVVTLASTTPQDIHQSNQLEWALHNMERAADRTINICEWVLYVATGVYTEMGMGEYECPPIDESH